MKKDNGQTDKTWFSDSLRLFARLNIWAIFPIISAAFLGRYLDGRFGTKPWILIILIILAFNITIYKFWKEAKKVLDE